MRQALLLTTLLATAAHAEAPFSFDATPGKLPKTVVPSAYRIEVTPDLTKLTLAGNEAIDITVRKTTAIIVLNQAGLTLQSATLDNGVPATIKLDEKLQEATLTFLRPVPAGKHVLKIAYTGPIPESPNGIYYDDYKTPAGAKKRMLVTQFEVADARRMFPGWDEPAFKATFQLTANLPADLAVVSNMPVQTRSVSAAGVQHVVFGTSPRMSTYLLALVAGDMEAVRGQAGATQMAAWAPKGEASKAQYALDVEMATLPYYNEYFGTSYPLPKLDLIAIPGNYEAGAMENWGAITFIDDAMLFDPKTSSPRTREEIPLVVNHEMAHQWSGDLVTMGWWSNIWLNEGFATWMELKATDHFNPAWQIWPRQHNDREGAMEQDALPTTHPIQQPIHDETEANTAFDRISYQKGSQIIRMVEDWIGPDVFRDGMRAYMKAHSYSNSTSADLWAALGAAAHKDVAHVAASFTEQPGIPLVHVAHACVGGHAQLTLSQDRFTIHDPHPKALSWTIPVTIGMQGGQTARVLLGAKPLVVKAGACDAWAKANWGENGYYRTQYDAASLAALARVLPSLAPADRANLLGDTFALFLANRIKLQAYLDLLAADRDEQNIAVWTDTLDHLAALDKALAGSPAEPRLHAYEAALIRPEAARLGWDSKPGELFLDALLRPRILYALGRAEDAATLAQARRRFDVFLKDPASLSPALRGAVLNLVGRTADQATWETLKRLGIAATSTEEKLRYFSAMAFAQDPSLIAQNVAFSDAGEIPNGRITQFLNEVSENSGHADLVYADTKPIVAKLAARVPSDGLGPTPLVAAAAASSNPEIAKAIVAEPSSKSSIGARIWAARAADGIGTQAELKGRVLAQFKG